MGSIRRGGVEAAAPVGASSTADGESWEVTGVVYWDGSTGGRHSQDNVPVDVPIRDQYQNMRRRSVTDLEQANFNLSVKIDELELEMQSLKAKKKAMRKRHLEELRSRDRREIAILLIVASCVVMYLFFALLIRGFV